MKIVALNCVCVLVSLLHLCACLLCKMGELLLVAVKKQNVGMLQT